MQHDLGLLARGIRTYSVMLVAVIGKSSTSVERGLSLVASVDTCYVFINLSVRVIGSSLTIFNLLCEF